MVDITISGLEKYSKKKLLASLKVPNDNKCHCKFKHESELLFVVFKCQVVQKFNIIKKFRMFRQRKKLVVDGKGKGKAVVVDSETDEREKDHELISHKQKGKPSKVISQKSQNPYEQIDFIPQIQLSKQDMKGDPVVLIAKLQQKYKEYGAVKIKACPQWQPPLCFKYTEKGITTRIQKIHRLLQGKGFPYKRTLFIDFPLLIQAFHEKVQQYNIQSFTHMAEEFQKNYRFKFNKEGNSPETQLQNQYWQIVRGVKTDNPKQADKYKVTVEYAADLPVHRHGSGFPLHKTLRTEDQHFDYASSFYNLNNMFKSPSSILKISEQNNQKISGITIPWVYMGMMFSSFCWHVEDLWLNSLNYSHKGAIKTWYVIPESDKQLFDAYVLKKTGKREFLNSITFMIDPIELKENGIKVYKAYQRPHEFILTLFGAYHGGFSQGWNIGEAVNVGTVDSLQAIKKAQRAALQFKNHKPPVLCYEWLISGNLNNTKINRQHIKREYSKMIASQNANLKRAMDKIGIEEIEWIDSSQKYDKMSCSLCRHYQYLSLLQCSNCLKKYCLEHATKCCGKNMILLSRRPDCSRKKNLELVEEK